jgi:hypothetical protein
MATQLLVTVVVTVMVVFQFDHLFPTATTRFHPTNTNTKKPLLFRLPHHSCPVECMALVIAGAGMVARA